MPFINSAAVHRLYVGYGLSYLEDADSGGSAGEYLDIQSISRSIQLADQSGVDYFTLPDSADTSADNPAALAWEPFTTAAWLAAATRRIGLLVTARAGGFEPFNLARLTASLDHITHGRAGWFAGLPEGGNAAANYATGPTASGHAGPEHFAEYVAVVRKLWDSWEDDAFVRDKASGVFVHPERIRAVAHRGAAFAVQGALNVARPPQGQPPLVLPWSRGIDPVALEADVVLVPHEQAARALRAAHPQWRGRVLGQVVFRIDDAAAADDATAAPGGWRLAGPAAALAQALIALADRAGLDGFDLTPAGAQDRLGQLDRASRELLPLLAAHGAAPPAAATLRQRLGLARPANRLAATAA